MNLESRCFVPCSVGFGNIDLRVVPYDVNHGIVETVRDVTADIVTEEGKARALYYWCIDNFKLDYKSRDYFYQSASQAFSSRRGRCVDFAFLYNAMARVAGLQSCLVDVYRDYRNKRLDHVCSGVYLDGKLTFVDLNYNFGAKHRNFRVLNDEETNDFYDCCLRANNGEKNVFSRFIFTEDDRNLFLDVLAFLFRRKFLYVVASLQLTFNFTSGYDFDFKFDLDSRFNTDVDVALTKNGQEDLDERRHKIEKELTDGRASRFQAMLSELRQEYPLDNRLNNLEYNQDNFLYVSGLYIKYLKRNNTLFERNSSTR